MEILIKEKNFLKQEFHSLNKIFFYIKTVFIRLGIYKKIEILCYTKL